jgi:CheY-like chemotaxis protein/histone H3/H4
MGSRILLADDSITIQKVVNLTFADEGIEVVAVSNGDLAERRLNEVQPDLVLADIFMPGKNGYELCEAIKENPQFRNVPVVLLVGAFEPFDQAEARRVRADAHLTKPFESRTLVETVRRLISASALAATGPIAPLPSPGEGREDMHHADPVPTRVITPTTPRLDASEMMADDNIPPATSVGKTGELASLPADASPQVFNFGVTDMPDHEAPEAAFTGASEQFNPLELASIGELANGETQSSPEPNQPDVILDFDKDEVFESSAPLGTDPFETEGSAQAEGASTGSGEGAEWFSKDHLDNRAVESVSANNARRANAITAPLNVQGAAFRMHNETALASSESATMLALDDPLGDLLLDETVSSGMSPFGHDLLDIELTGPAVSAASAVVADTQFDLVETAEESSDSPQTFAVVEDGIADDPKLHEPEGTLSMTDQKYAGAEGPPVDSQADFVESDDILDWTSPDAGSFSTAQPDSEIIPIDSPESQSDSVMMAVDTSGSQLDSARLPIDDAEPLAENPVDAGAQGVDNIQEASFESARTWPEEEARFAAIDIEAFPVEESEAPAHLEVTETGFSLAPLTPEQPGTSTGAPAANTTPSEKATNGASSSAELSSATIEEIVRRVVAKMSESVVREVAWEVVPDCVERVIDQLTRESLSKRA